jgi:hypothetical protein
LEKKNEINEILAPRIVEMTLIDPSLLCLTLSDLTSLGILLFQLNTGVYLHIKIALILALKEHLISNFQPQQWSSNIHFVN